MSSSNRAELHAEMIKQTTQLMELADRLKEESALDRVPDEVVQQLLTLAVKCYAAKRESDVPLFPFVGVQALTATEVGLTVSNMIKAAELDLFELAMWQSLR